MNDAVTTDPTVARRALRGNPSALASFAESAFDSVRELQARNRNLEAEVEALSRELALAQVALDRFVGGR